MREWLRSLLSEDLVSESALQESCKQLRDTCARITARRWSRYGQQITVHVVGICGDVSYPLPMPKAWPLPALCGTRR